MLVQLWQSTRATAIKIRSLTEKVLPPSFLDSFLNGKQPDEIPPLHFPEVGNVLPQLLQLGLDANRAQLFHHEFISTVEQLDEYLSHSYQNDAPKFRSVKGQTSRAVFVEAMQSQMLVVRSQSIQKLWITILSHVQALQRVEPAQPTPQSTPASSAPSTSSAKPRGRAKNFTKEQTAVLNALLVHANQFSTQEKDFIAYELGLTRDQVNRWFCNARARKKPYTCPARQPASAALESLSISSTRSNSPATQPEQSPSQASPPTPASDDSDMIVTTSSDPSSSPPREAVQSLPQASSPRTPASDDSDMVITTSSDSSSSSGDDDPMDAFFDFPAYDRLESAAQEQQNAFPSAPQGTLPQNPVPFDFSTLNYAACSSPLSHAAAIDPRLWTPQTALNLQSFAC